MDWNWSESKAFFIYIYFHHLPTWRDAGGIFAFCRRWRIPYPRLITGSRVIGREAARRRRHTRPQPHSVHRRPRWSLSLSALRLTNGPQKSNTRLHPSPPCRSDRYTKKTHTRSLRTRSRAQSRMCVAADPEKSKKQLLKKKKGKIIKQGVKTESGLG